MCHCEHCEARGAAPGAPMLDPEMWVIHGTSHAVRWCHENARVHLTIAENGTWRRFHPGLRSNCRLPVPIRRGTMRTFRVGRSRALVVLEGE